MPLNTSWQVIEGTVRSFLAADRHHGGKFQGIEDV
jgi:hypothetical protein